MGLTDMKVKSFFLVSLIGMLAGTALYVNAGSQLASIEKVSDILDPYTLVALLVIGLFVILSKKLKHKMEFL
jgi:uncharacterized membrane protein YdjX (TVP38/TMEM64 family)